jgi:hypothetical protein
MAQLGNVRRWRWVPHLPARPPAQPGTDAPWHDRTPDKPFGTDIDHARHDRTSAASDAAAEQRRHGNHGDSIVIMGRNAPPAAVGLGADGQVAANMPGNGFDIVGTRLSFTRHTGDQSRWKNARDHCSCPCKLLILPQFASGHCHIAAMSPATVLPPLPGHVQADRACTAVSDTRFADARVASPAKVTESGALSTARPISA